MSLQRMLSGDPRKSSMLYLGIGVLSLVKAIAVRNDAQRFRRELLDAALFLAVGLVLRKYSTLKAQKREELTQQVPDWLLEDTGDLGNIRTMAQQRLGGEPEPEPEPTLRERAKGVVGS